MAVLRHDQVRHQSGVHTVDTVGNTSLHVAMIRWAMKDDVAGAFDHGFIGISARGFDEVRFFFTDPDTALAFRMRWT